MSAVSPQSIRIRAALVAVPWCWNGRGNQGGTGFACGPTEAATDGESACGQEGLAYPADCNPSPATCDTSRFPTTNNVYGTAVRIGCYAGVSAGYQGAWCCNTEDGGFTEPCCSDTVFSSFTFYTGDQMQEDPGAYFPPVFHRETLNTATCMSSLDGAAATLNPAIAGCADGIQSISSRTKANDLLDGIELTDLPWDTYTITAPPLDPVNTGAWLDQPPITTRYIINPNSLPMFLVAGTDLADEHCWSCGYLYADIFAFNGLATAYNTFLTDGGAGLGFTSFVNPSGYEYCCSKVEIQMQGCQMFGCKKDWSMNCVVSSNDCNALNGGTGTFCFGGSATCPSPVSTNTRAGGTTITLTVARDSIGWSMAHVWSNNGEGCSTDHNTTSFADGTTNKCCP